MDSCLSIHFSFYDELLNDTFKAAVTIIENVNASFCEGHRARESLGQDQRLRCRGEDFIILIFSFFPFYILGENPG